MTIVAALMTVFFMQPTDGGCRQRWVIFGEDRFRWSATMIGLSLAVFGILHAPSLKRFVTGPATKRFGEKQAIIAGAAADALGYVFGVRDARLDGLHYDSSRFRRHQDARVAGHAVQAGR